MSNNTMSEERYDCQECGKKVYGYEYHPYLHCQLFKVGLLDEVKSHTLSKQIEARIDEIKSMGHIVNWAYYDQRALGRIAELRKQQEELK